MHVACARIALSGAYLIVINDAMLLTKSESSKFHVHVCKAIGALPYTEPDNACMHVHVDCCDGARCDGLAWLIVNVYGWVIVN